MINLIVNNIGLNEKTLAGIRSQLIKGSQDYLDLFDILVKKLRALKKTKEEMIKFSMRKAFKYLFQVIK